MGTIGEAGYVLSLRELVFLAAITGAEEIYGVEDNTYLMNEKELEREWEKVKSQLEAKKYIDVELDDTITIDRDLYALIEACCHPGVFIRYAGKNVESKERIRNCYITERIAVELDTDRLLKDTYILTPLVSIKKVAENYKECFRVEGSYESQSLSFAMQQPEFKTLTELIENSDDDEAMKLLTESGCENEAVRDIYEALKQKSLYMSMIVMQIDDAGVEDIISFSVVGGQEYLWKVEISTSEDESEIKFKTSSPDMVVEEVEKLILQIEDLYRAGVERDDSIG